MRPGQGPPGRPPGTRKARCGDQGPAVSQAQCSECGETFGGDHGFDRHRVNVTGKPGFDLEYDWRCATPAEMEARGLHRDAKGARRPLPVSASAPGPIFGGRLGHWTGQREQRPWSDPSDGAPTGPRPDRRGARRGCPRVSGSAPRRGPGPPAAYRGRTPERSPARSRGGHPRQARTTPRPAGRSASRSADRTGGARRPGPGSAQALGWSRYPRRTCLPGNRQTLVLRQGHSMGE